MKCFSNLFYLILGMIVFSSLLYGKDDITANKILANSSQGKEFYIAIPPNEIENYTTNLLEAYITSTKNCTVTLENVNTGKKVNKQVKAMEITVFSDKDGELTWDLECRESEVVKDQALRITSTEPISVYVLNSKTYTSDGYLAIPVSSWGQEYFHLSYYDFNEVSPWAGGFIVVAAYDKTKINIELNGRGKGYAKTKAGKDIGDKYTNITLNKGQTFMVRGDATTRGQFDLSGSRITSNKPVGLISFHMRTIIPSFEIYNGRDCLSEMLSPVTAWGKKYVTVEYKRDSGEGDFFRIIASQDNTKWKVTYYDDQTKDVLGHYSGQLKKAGDFDEYLEVLATVGDGIKSINGTSVWEADKPVLLMQYAYSADWDGNDIFDPFMILVTPEEQFLTSTVFQTPANKAFVTNWFNVIAVHDPLDTNFTDLQSLTIDKKPIWTLESSFMFNNIPTTNMYWAKIAMQPGAHVIKGDGKIKFGGYIYGFSEWDSYGWPAAMSFNKLDETDTLPPQYYPTQTCGDYTIRTTELRTSTNPNDNPKQVDQGISEIYLIESVNYELVFPTEFINWPPIYDYTFKLNVKDKTKDAYAYYQIADRAGNNAIDSVFYKVDKIEFDPPQISFGNQRVNTTKQINSVIENIMEKSQITIKSISLKKADVFTIVDGAISTDLIMKPKDTHPVRISYTPIQESASADIKDIDTLIVTTECARFTCPIDGRGVIPRITVENWDAGPVVVGKTVCKSELTGSGLLIQNPGTDTLIITDITGVVAPFKLSTPYTPALPIIIAPGKSVELKDICYTPSKTISSTIDVTFANNGEGPDSISTWQGKGIQPGPYISDKNWYEKRVKTINQGSVYLKNSGTSTVRVTDVVLSNTSDNNFKIIDKGFSSSPFVLREKGAASRDTMLEIKVQFEPQSEFAHNNSVTPVFHPDDGIAEGSVAGILDGFGILPKIEVIGYEFTPAILVGETHPDIGYVKIKSTSETADLYVESIKFKNASQTEFTWETTVPAAYTLARNTEKKIPVKFNAQQIGERKQIVEIISDAKEGPEVDPRTQNDTLVWGYAYEKGLSASDYNFETVLLCNSPVGSVNIINLSTSTPAVVDSLVFVIGSSKYFKFTDFSAPMTVPINSSSPLKVQFLPDSIGSFYAEVLVYGNGGDTANQRIVLKGKTYDVSIAFGLQKHDASEKLAPGQKDVPLSVYASSSQWGDAAIKEFEFDIVYKRSWFKYDNAIMKGPALDDSWNYTATESKVDNIYNKLHITAKGSIALNSNGVVLIPKFQILLDTVNSFVPVLDSSSVDLKDRAVCVKWTKEDGYVVINSCVLDFRGIIVSPNSYCLYEVNPNPVATSSINLKYTVGAKGQTKIEIYNYKSDLVKVIIDGEISEGSHETGVNVSDLPSGLYYIRMISGPYDASKRLVIER